MINQAFSLQAKLNGRRLLNVEGSHISHRGFETVQGLLLPQGHEIGPWKKERMGWVEMIKESLDTSFSKVHSGRNRFRFEGYQFPSDVKLREIDMWREQKLDLVVGKRGRAV